MDSYFQAYVYCMYLSIGIYIYIYIYIKSFEVITPSLSLSIYPSIASKIFSNDTASGKKSTFANKNPQSWLDSERNLLGWVRLV